MAILLKNVILSLEEKESTLRQKVADLLKISPEQIQKLKIVKKSLDARRKNRIHFLYTLELSLPAEQETRVLDQPSLNLQVQKVFETALPAPGRIKRKPKLRPIIVGTGPAGLFAALKLTENGLPPMILERGKEIPGAGQGRGKVLAGAGPSRRRVTSSSEKEGQGLSRTANFTPVSMIPGFPPYWKPFFTSEPLRKSFFFRGPTSAQTGSGKWFWPCANTCRNWARNSNFRPR